MHSDPKINYKIWSILYIKNFNSDSRFGKKISKFM